MEDRSRPFITTLLHRIKAAPYEPLSIEEGSTDEERELINTLNQIFLERRELVKQSQARDRLIIDSTPVAICITDEEGRYEYTNPTYRRLTGYEQQELIGSHFSLVVPTETQKELADLHDEFMGRRYELTGQWEIVSKEGVRIPIIANAAYVIDVDDRPKKITFVIEITELIETQERLKKEVEERRRLEHIRDNVERILRHDLRNPIDGIRTAAEFLLEDDLGERPNEFIRLMYDAAVRARNRIDNSLAYTQMQQGSYSIQRKRINVVQLVRSVTREVSDVLSAYRTSIIARYRGSALKYQYDVELWGEEDFLHDGLTNLVRNAVEASSPGAEIIVDVDEVENETDTDGVDPTGDPSMVTISVHNEADIPEEIRERLFDPYVTFGKRSGTGLGTYTAYLIARAHGGSIDVDTGERKGTTITLRLPRGRLNG